MKAHFETVDDLEAALSQPTPAVLRTLESIPGDLLFLGAGGKMGPTLAMMAKRAVRAIGQASRRVIAVSRFSDSSLIERLERAGVDVIQADLLDQAAVDRLPEAPNIYYLAGMKFGATGNEPLTWAMNSYLPTVAARRYPKSRIVALSTGNIYGLVPHDGGGSVESDPLRPVGEYANSCLGRERLFAYFSQAQATPTVMIRLNYANELRYGVVVDLARKVLAGEPIDLAMGYVNIIWQGDANAHILSALDQASTPCAALNVAGLDTLRVRDLAEKLGQIAEKPAILVGTEQPDALLSNARRAADAYGAPTIPIHQLLQWTVHWLRRGGTTLAKPTMFENRAGTF